MAVADAQPTRPLTAESPVRAMLARLGFYLFVVVVAACFALPMVWLITTPFTKNPGFHVRVPAATLTNFRQVFRDPNALPSLRNAIILAAVTMVLVRVLAALGSYALSRVRVPGRNLILYILLLFSSMVTGSAAMVPLFLEVFKLGLIDSYVGVILVLAAGLMPAAFFILKDFMDAMPATYEESARVFGANSFQILRDVVAPAVRPGLAVIAVWTVPSSARGQVRDGEEIVLGARPEYTKLHRVEQPHAIAGGVAVLESLGVETLVMIEAGDVTVQATVPEGEEPATGEVVYAVPDPARALLYQAETGDLVSADSTPTAERADGRQLETPAGMPPAR